MAENKVETYTTKEEAGRREEQIIESANALGLEWVEYCTGPEEVTIGLLLDRQAIKQFTIRTEESEEIKMERLREKLNQLCGDAQTKLGVYVLITHYINDLGWTEKRAFEYAIELFENGTIEQIKILGGNNNED